MDHAATQQDHVAERYLLGELDAETRHQFEEHVFDCVECALDLCAGAKFVEGCKVVLRQPEPQTAPAAVPEAVRNQRWFAWLRPAIAAPVMALLLAVVGYQSFVSIPKARRAMTQPQVFPAWATVSVGTYGEGPIVTAAPGQAFLLFVRIPSDVKYTGYMADLYNPAGKIEWSVRMPAVEGQQLWPLRVPGTNRPPGTYSLAVRGIVSAEKTEDIGRASFELQTQSR
jgi:hypothetical protein